MSIATDKSSYKFILLSELLPVKNAMWRTPGLLEDILKEAKIFYSHGLILCYFFFVHRYTVLVFVWEGQYWIFSIATLEISFTKIRSMLYEPNMITLTEGAYWVLPNSAVDLDVFINISVWFLITSVPKSKWRIWKW